MNELVEKCMSVHEYCANKTDSERGAPGAPGQSGKMGLPGLFFFYLFKVLINKL